MDGQRIDRVLIKHKDTEKTAKNEYEGGQRGVGSVKARQSAENGVPPSPFRTQPSPFLSTLTNAQTLWSDLAGFAGRDSASIKTRAISSD